MPMRGDCRQKIMKDGVTKFTLKDVRCFAGEQSVDIRPITLLVGENSTGKSTVLGCYDAFFSTEQNMDFNRAPYQMGGVKTIARQSATKNAKFALEANIIAGDSPIQCSIVLEEIDSELVVSNAKYSLMEGSITIVYAPQTSQEQKSEPFWGVPSPISYKETIGKNHFVFDNRSRWSPPPSIRCWIFFLTRLITPFPRSLRHFGKNALLWISLLGSGWLAWHRCAPSRSGHTTR